MTTANCAFQTYPPGGPLGNQAHSVPPATGSIIDEVPIDRISECAVILSWREIMPPRAGLIYVEYGTRAGKQVVIQVYPPNAKSTLRAELLRTLWPSWTQGDMASAQPENADKRMKAAS